MPWADRLADALCRKRSWPLLLAVSLAIGVAHALTMLPLPLILGTGEFWSFPRGTVPGSANDMAQVLVGYLALLHAPWGWPLLHVPDLVPPEGTNIFWLDAVPLVDLAAKAVFTTTGAVVNLLGIFLLACLALPGVAMTLLLGLAGQRGLIAAAAGAMLADAMPFLLFEWGHIALSAQFLVVLALALYLASLHRPGSRFVAAGWLGLLAVALLTNIYLFVMAAGCWCATLAQRRFDRTAPDGRLLAEAGIIVAAILVCMLATGILTPDLRSAGTAQFGEFSMNLGSPFVPQLSGAIPPLGHYWIGMRSQVFTYLGLGGLLVLLAALATGLRRFRARSHLALLVLFAGFYLFALSNRITLGSHLLVHIPLPEAILHAFGAFRAGGRFFWPIGYAATAFGVLVILRGFRPRIAVALLLLAGVLQLVDVSPQRQAIAETTGHPVTAVIDRPAATALIARSRGVWVFPTFDCVEEATGVRDTATEESRRVGQAVMELQLLAARANRPINSADNARLATDCAAERQQMRDRLRPENVYFYLTPFIPLAEQLAGQDPAAICHVDDRLRDCLVP